MASATTVMVRFPTCRVIVETAPRTGAENMAIDEALLDAAAEAGAPTVRWYRWAKPTVSLGYFQGEDAAAAWIAKGVAVVRRLTGGGAILHDREWTYSVTLPTLSPLLRHPYELYDVVHESLIGTLKSRFGIELVQRGSTRKSPQEPVLCYLREDEHDVVLNGVKIIGSAQRRRRGALLQHGSLLLHESHFAPGIPGLYDLLPHLDGHLDVFGPWQKDLALAMGEHIA